MADVTKYPQPIRHPRTTRVSCGHTRYGMSCTDLDALYKRARRACEICKRPEISDPLNIDHDGFLGEFAVRGLLCTSCNGSIGTRLYPHPFDSEPAAKRFLDNPWWARPNGPRPLGRTRFAVGEHDKQIHVVGWSGVRRVGKHHERTGCGQTLLSAFGVQLYNVQDPKICIPCAEHNPVEIERLEYYRSHPSAFAL